VIAEHVPQPRSERGPWAAAIGLGALGLAILALALSGVLAGGSTSVEPTVLAVAPTAVMPVARTPTPSPAAADAAAPVSTTTVAGHPAIVGEPSSEEAQRDLAAYLDPTSVHIPESWMAGFYPIYATAQRTFAVNWLLIASIHRQESAFSTAPGIYHGLNFAGCCGGPMQFNVTNAPRTTWSLVSDSYRYAARPSSYDHMTARHPSIYDDFDSIMAAAHLLSADGAGAQLDGSAWSAAYDYYGHDATGVTYADQVLARAISWSQHGFCINCAVPPSTIAAVQAAWGAPVLTALEAQEALEARQARARRQAARRRQATLRRRRRMRMRAVRSSSTGQFTSTLRR
jgi:hypothetical protein